MGALLKALVDHVLLRKEKKIDFAEKSIRVADALMTRMYDELTHTQQLLEDAKQDGEALRAELASRPTTDAYEKLNEQMRRYLAQLIQASRELDVIRSDTPHRPTSVEASRIPPHLLNALREAVGPNGSIEMTSRYVVLQSDRGSLMTWIQNNEDVVRDVEGYGFKVRIPKK